MKRSKLLKFNEWTSWRDDLYDQPEKGDPDVEWSEELKKKDEPNPGYSNILKIRKRKKQNKKVKGIMVDKNWKPKEVEELTDKYHWTEQDLKDMKLI